MNDTEKKIYLFDRPGAVKAVLFTLYGACGVLLLIDFVIHRHVSHSWERLLGFYSIYGFLGCSAIVIAAKVLRVLVQRDEDYYEQDGSGDVEKQLAGESSDVA